MTRDGDGYILTTGRRVYAHDGFIGIPARIQPGDDLTEFAEGYDGHIHTYSINSNTYTWQKKQNLSWLLTHAEAIEICEAMIQAWIERRDFFKGTNLP